MVSTSIRGHVVVAKRRFKNLKISVYMGVATYSGKYRR